MTNTIPMSMNIIATYVNQPAFSFRNTLKLTSSLQQKLQVLEENRN